MYGRLVPASGGKAIPLTRERVYLGRRAEAERTLPLNAETALCLLRFLDGWWYREDLEPSCGERKPTRIEPNAELVVGLRRFRIDYQSPREAQAALEAVAEGVLGIGRHDNPAAIFPGGGGVPRSQTNHLLGRLVPLGGGLDYPLMKPRLTVGRKPDCDVVIRSRTVSALHCGLELVEGYWRILDLGGRNGIRVNGVRCQRGWLFRNSRLSIADQRFQIDYSPQGPPPEPDLNDPTFRMPLMQKVAASEGSWQRAIARLGAAEEQEPKSIRYDVTEDF